MHRFACLIPLAVFALASLPLEGQQETPRNSTKKTRIAPTEFAAKCGSAVDWRASVDEALKESAESGKPVFWYVPTLRGSFMDRKPEIDRYMMAGPFSWPAVVSRINENFIPVKANASGKMARALDLVPYKFVEPGFVVLNSKGLKTALVDQITTFSPEWLVRLIDSSIGISSPQPPRRGSLDDAWDAFRAGNFAFDDSGIEASSDDIAEKILLQGMFAFRRGDHDKARTIWMSAANTRPDHPLAWKAAAEAENWGPFVRGFEVHGTVPEAALTAGRQSRGSAAPAGLYSEQQLWQQSIAFLLGMQANNGGWFDSDYDFGGTDSLPNVHMAVTSLVGIALIDALEKLPEQRPEILAAIDRAAGFVANRNNINFDDRDEILWANAYRVRFLSRLVALGDENNAGYRAELEKAVADLQSIQTKSGSWFHEYANPFVTATALLALKIGQEAGAVVDADQVKRGVAALTNDRFANGAFPYYGDGSPHDPAKAGGEGKIPESSGRMPLCELALWQWNASSDERLQSALAASLENHKYLAVGYKYDNHTSTMAYGGFFFWYDMRSRAEAISFVSDPGRREAFAAAHRQLLVNLPEFDGCFVDSHELGRCYGTAMALQSLAILDRIENLP